MDRGRKGWIEEGKDEYRGERMDRGRKEWIEGGKNE